MSKYTVTMDIFRHKLSEENQESITLHGKEIWRPSVPLPLYVGFRLKKAKCGCGRVFKDEQAYEEHYIYQAVWQDESGYIPSLLKKNTMTAAERKLLEDNKELLRKK